MIFFCKCINIKVSEQINNPFIVFPDNLEVLKNEGTLDRKTTK